MATRAEVQLWDAEPIDPGHEDYAPRARQPDASVDAGNTGNNGPNPTGAIA